jgi:CheY-like chemotaxis protein
MRPEDIPAEIASLREALAQAQARADGAQRDKSRFLGMLSHELLTPLQSVVSSMDLIETKGSVSRTDHVFLRLREATRALQARTSDLVDFAKMSGGRLVISQRKFRVDRLVEDVIAEHEEAVVHKDLDVHWEPGLLLAQQIVTDPRRVRQILDNLVSNAIKYTPRGSVMIEASLTPETRRLTLEVRDTGVGIAPQAIPHIFEPFYRVASATQFAQGSGLGLAVVQRLVELLEGEITVESVLGQGSLFRVSIPYALARGPESASAVQEAAARNPDVAAARRVLVVDDAHDARTVVAQTVRALGWVCDEAGSAAEALRVLGTQAYAVVLLDMELAGVSGFEVIATVRNAVGPNRSAYFVMMSAAPENHAALGLFNARADKPVNRQRLSEVLSDVA